MKDKIICVILTSHLYLSLAQQTGDGAKTKDDEEKEKLIDRYWLDDYLGEAVVQPDNEQTDRLHKLFDDIPNHKPDLMTNTDIVD